MTGLSRSASTTASSTDMSLLLPLISLFPAKLTNSIVTPKLSAKKLKTIRLAQKKTLPLQHQIIVELKINESRARLMQKVNGNTVNGKAAAFKESERQQFREALQDLSKRIYAVAMTI